MKKKVNLLSLLSNRYNIMENKNNKILEIIKKEKFLAFFDFQKIGENGESELDGLCKVACPSSNDAINYISLTFIFDTPTESAFLNAKRTIAKITTDVIKAEIPEAFASTSVPAAEKHPSYVHQIDIFFKPELPLDTKPVINKLVYLLRNEARLNTEPPQWWDDDSAPEASEAEKSNWSARIMAFLGLE